MAHLLESLGIGELDGEGQKVDNLAHEVLGKTYVTLKTEHLELSEDFGEGKAIVKARMFHIVDDVTTNIEIQGGGVGLVDALFDGMLKNFAREYASLSTVSIVDFNIGIKLKGTHGRRTDALAIATLRVKNSDDYEYTFLHRTPSISQSSVGVVQDVVRFFVNSERAYIQLYVALDDAKKRGRPDLVERYQNQMATLVRATSYKEIVARIATSPFVPPKAN
jgi:hypothetical protein